MRSRKIDAIVNLIILALWMTVALVLIFFANVKFSISALDIIMYSLAGFLVHYALSLLFHELGHLIFSAFCHMRPIYVNFGLFSVRTYPEKKVGFLTYFSREAGESSFVPKKKIKPKHVKILSLGGLIFSLIYALFCLCTLIYSPNPLLFCFMGIGSCSAFYLLTVNVLPFDKTSDGALILNKQGYCDVITAVSNHQMKVMQNVVPEEAVVFKKSSEPFAVYYHYCYLLMQNRKEEAYYLILTLENKLNDLTDDEYTLLFPEILFVSCIKNRMDEDLKNRAEVFFTEEEAHPSAVRAHFIYRKTTGDKEWAKILLGSYKNLLTSCPNFILSVEKQFSEHIH